MHKGENGQPVCNDNNAAETPLKINKFTFLQFHYSWWVTWSALSPGSRTLTSVDQNKPAPLGNWSKPAPNPRHVSVTVGNGSWGACWTPCRGPRMGPGVGGGHWEISWYNPEEIERYCVIVTTTNSIISKMLWSTRFENLIPKSMLDCIR